LVTQCHQRHRSSEFRPFLDAVDAAVPRNPDVHLIMAQTVHLDKERRRDPRQHRALRPAHTRFFRPRHLLREPRGQDTSKTPPRAFRFTLHTYGCRFGYGARHAKQAHSAEQVQNVRKDPRGSRIERRRRRRRPPCNSLSESVPRRACPSRVLASFPLNASGHALLVRPSGITVAHWEACES
jgi:hypothetical protein